MKSRLLALCASTALLAGCGGGSGSSSLPISSASHGKVNATFVINVPSGSTTQSRTTQSVKPQYLSQATQSITLDITGPTTITQTQNLTVNSSGCTSSLASTICTLTVALAPCTSPATNCYTASLTTYDQTGGTGNVLSAAQSIVFTVTSGQNNNVYLTLSGVPAQTIVAPTSSLTGEHSGGGFDLYGQGPQAFDVYTVDADGNIIVGSGAPTFTLTTNSNAMAATITAPTSTSPNSFTIAPPATYTSSTTSITMTPTFSGQATNGCGQTGANCNGATITADMAVLIYVTNLNNNTVTAYNDEGVQQTLTGSFTNVSFNSGYALSSGIAYDSSDGDLYVVNDGNTTVTAYNEEGVQQTLSGSFAGLNIPTAIAYDPNNGYLYVGNAGGPITVYTGEGTETLIGDFSSSSNDDAIAYDPGNGDLYAANGGAGVFFAYTNEGAQIFAVCSPECTSGFPGGIAYDPDNGDLYLTEAGTPAPVTAFNDDGVQQTLTGSFPNMNDPEGIAYDPSNGNLYIANRNNATVTAYSDEGAQQTLSGTFPSLDGPGGIVIVP